MLDGAIMEFVKWYIALVFVLFSVALVMFFFQVGDTNNFKQQVNHTIERKGGLTETAMIEIEEISDTNFGGRYTVERVKSEEDSADVKKVEYGEVVDYVIHADFNIMFIPNDVNMTFTGSSVSQVR